MGNLENKNNEETLTIIENFIPKLNIVYTIRTIMKGKT